MKKRILIGLFLMGALASHTTAQNHDSFFYVTNRTIIRDTNYNGYLFNRPLNNKSTSMDIFPYTHATENEFIGCRYHSESPLRIYGVAATVCLTYFNIPNLDSMWAMIIKKDGNRYIVIDSTRLRLYYKPRRLYDGGPLRYSPTEALQAWGWDVRDSLIHDSTIFHPLIEAYFENPPEVSDTFYVGIKQPPFRSINNPISYLTMGWFWGTDWRDTLPSDDLLWMEDMEYVNLQDRTGPGYNGGYQDLFFMDPNMTFFPIIKPYEEDSVFCDTVPGFHLESMRVGYPTFAWDTDWFREEDLYEVQHAPFRSNEWTTVSTADSSIEVYSVFEPGVYYQARVRARRHHRSPIHDTVMWGPWCRPLLFYVGTTEPDTTAIDPVDVGTAAFFSLSPNPTDGRVTVEVAGERPTATGGEMVVTVTDAKGREMLRQKASTLSPRRTVLNLEDLPAATYFVTVTLAGLSATQKLVLK